MILTIIIHTYNVDTSTVAPYFNTLHDTANIGGHAAPIFKSSLLSVVCIVLYCIVLYGAAAQVVVVVCYNSKQKQRANSDNNNNNTASLRKDRD